jgi:hypothetical protein
MGGSFGYPDITDHAEKLEKALKHADYQSVPGLGSKLVTLIREHSTEAEDCAID